jgi:hypothetical protein
MATEFFRRWSEGSMVETRRLLAGAMRAADL